MAPKTKYLTSIDVIISVPIICDSSIAFLNPPNGFVFKTVSFEQYLFSKNMRDYNGNVLLDYVYALFDRPEKILVLEHQNTYTLELNEPIQGGLFGLSTKEESTIKKELAVVKEALVETLRRYFALLHIYKEGDVAYKKIFVRYAHGTNYICPHVNHFDAITFNQNPMIIQPHEVQAINTFILNHSIAFDMIKEVAVDDLVCTYHSIYNATNYKNLFTILEALLIDGYSKSDTLAKRLAVLTKSSNSDIDARYTRFKHLYDIRNNAVHRGDVSQITKALVDEMRDIVREVIKAYFNHIENYILLNPSASFSQAKVNCIKHLKRKIKSKATWPQT